MIFYVSDDDGDGTMDEDCAMPAPGEGKPHNNVFLPQLANNYTENIYFKSL